MEKNSFRLNINRQVPLSNQFHLFFGNLLVQIGCFIVSVTMIFVWAILPKIDLSYIGFQLEIVETKGKITNIVEIYSPNSTDRNNYIYQYFYSFKNNKKQKLESHSYYNKKKKKFRIGKTIIIEYPKGKIYLSRIKGMRRKSQPMIAIIIFIFPILGFSFIFLGLKQSLNILNLLKLGNISTAHFIKKEMANLKKDGQINYNFIFEFTYQNKKYTVSEKSDLLNFSESKKRQVLYLQENPKNVLLLDFSTSSPSINSQGNIESTQINNYYFFQIIPMFAHGAYFIYWISL